MKIVIDTNVLISGAIWGGTPGKVLEAWSDGAFETILGVEIVEEYLRTLKYMKRKYPETSSDVHNIVQAFISASQIIDVPPKSNSSISRDSDDDKFILTALAGKAKYIVTGDKDLLVLKKIETIRIVKPMEFLKILKCK